MHINKVTVDDVAGFLAKTGGPDKAAQEIERGWVAPAVATVMNGVCAEVSKRGVYGFILDDWDFGSIVDSESDGYEPSRPTLTWDEAFQSALSDWGSESFAEMEAEILRALAVVKAGI